MTLINRRDFLIGLSGFAFYNLYASSSGKSHKHQKLQKMEHYDMQLRPHHILDIISDHGKGTAYQPHPYGHSLHIVAPKLISDLDLKIKLVLHADDICEGCEHLLPDGKCKDVLAQLTPSPSKQAYNDVLDSRLFDELSIVPGTVTTTHQFLEAVNEKVPGIEKICTHPKEGQEERLQGLVSGLIKLGIREDSQVI
ncbi:MAG: hypothetical protein AMS26_23340 [Bacteroides sp. SM23_62]|nr:MAG: hypothetical protein AMS26_23340 [Bacteroides sp. SM23_62]